MHTKVALRKQTQLLQWYPLGREMGWVWGWRAFIICFIYFYNAWFLSSKKAFMYYLPYRQRHKDSEKCARWQYSCCDPTDLTWVSWAPIWLLQSYMNNVTLPQSLVQLALLFGKTLSGETLPGDILYWGIRAVFQTTWECSAPCCNLPFQSPLQLFYICCGSQSWSPSIKWGRWPAILWLLQDLERQNQQSVMEEAVSPPASSPVHLKYIFSQARVSLARSF